MLIVPSFVRRRWSFFAFKVGIIRDFYLSLYSVNRHCSKVSLVVSDSYCTNAGYASPSSLRGVVHHTAYLHRPTVALILNQVLRTS